MSVKSVVLIEDETIFRNMLRSVVEQPDSGMKVTGEFGDGKEGLEFCLKKPPALVICDLRLPGMHGYDVINSLREKQPDVRILVLTSRGDSTYPAQMAALGVQGYVDKTKPLPMLVEAVREVVSGGIYFAAKGAAPEPLQTPEHGLSPQQLPVVPGADPLSPREIEVAKLVAEGNASKEIADKLGLSVRTVEKHRANIMDKTGVRDVASITRYCIHHNLVRP